MGFILIAIALGGIAQLIRMYVTTRGKIAQRKIGAGVGMTFEEMRHRLGTPQAESINPDGDTVYQWLATSGAGAYHFAYVFRDGVCQGFAYQFKA